MTECVGGLRAELELLPSLAGAARHPCSERRQLAADAVAALLLLLGPQAVPAMLELLQVLLQDSLPQVRRCGCGACVLSVGWAQRSCKGLLLQCHACRSAAQRWAPWRACQGSCRAALTTTAKWCSCCCLLPPTAARKSLTRCWRLSCLRFLPGTLSCCSLRCFHRQAVPVPVGHSGRGGRGPLPWRAPASTVQRCSPGCRCWQSCWRCCRRSWTPWPSCPTPASCSQSSLQRCRPWQRPPCSKRQRSPTRLPAGTPLPATETTAAAATAATRAICRCQNQAAPALHLAVQHVEFSMQLASPSWTLRRCQHGWTAASRPAIRRCILWRQRRSQPWPARRC